MQVHFVGGRIEVQRSLAHGLAPSHDELAAVAQHVKPRTQVLHHAGHDADVVHVEQHALNLLVARRAFEGVQHLVQAHLHVGLQSSAQAEGKRHVVAPALHDGHVQRHLEDVGLVQVDLALHVGIDVSQYTHEPSYEHADKNENEDGACDDQPKGGSNRRTEDVFPK